MKTKIFLIAALLICSISAKGQCIWTIKWGMDCPSGPIRIMGCGDSSSPASFCGSSNPTECGCAKNGQFYPKPVTAPAGLCNCDCNSITVKINGVIKHNGDPICCNGTAGDCGNTCGCGTLVIDCTSREIRFTCP